jgi:hypothetical protein
LFNSKLVEELETKFPVTILKTIWHALDTFWDRTLSSNSVAESVKIRRLNTCGDVLSTIPLSFEFLFSLKARLSGYSGQTLVFFERLRAMAQRRTDQSLRVLVSSTARIRAARILGKMQPEKRDGRWIALSSFQCCVWLIEARPSAHCSLC